MEDIIYILENVNFTVDDLLIINDHFMPLIKNEGMMRFIAQIYKENISSKILPFIKDLNFIKENPGVLVNLVNWLNSYETLLTKVGFEISEF